MNRNIPHKPTRVALLAEYFRAHPHVWIDGVDLERIAGRYAWRSRVSDCRLQLGMTIENRQRWVQTALIGGGYTVSEYRFVPAVVAEQTPIAQPAEERLF